MSITKVKAYFKTFNIENRIQELEESSATVQLAALALHCEEARIAKTLSFKVNNEPILIVMTGDVKVNNTKFREQFHTKATLLGKEEVSDLIGHDVGGVCPFAVKQNVKIYLDNSLKKFKTVFPACGSSNSAIELTIEELEIYANTREWIDISKSKEEKFEE